MKTNILSILFFILFSNIPLFALRIESGSDIRITETVYEDIYVFGSTVYIDAPVHGDIWCAAGTVTVTDTVYGDLVVAGGNINLRGVVMDDVRAAGGTLIITGRIAGDLLVAGGTVSLEPNAAVEGDVAATGGTLTIGGPVKGALKASGGTVYLNGSVGKTLDFNGGDLNLNGAVAGASSIAATRIKLGNNAALGGNVKYWTEDGEIDFASALQNGAIATFDPSLRVHYERPDSKFLGFASFMAVLWYLIASFILIWLGQWLFSKTFQKAANTAQADAVRSLGYGFLYFVAVPVGIVLLFITIVGIPVGLIALLLYGLLFALANVITVLVAAHWINWRKNYQWRPVQLTGIALCLLIVLKILFSIPFVGWIFNAVVVLIAFGAILINTRLSGRTQNTVPST